VLTERLVANGISVAGDPRAGEAPPGTTAVAGVDSPPVAQLVAEMLTTSDNEASEAALKEIGVATGGEGTWPAGAAALTRLLGEAGVPLDGLEVVDGSGLTIEESGAVVRDGLAVAGESGTLAERWQGTDVAGRLRGKTGSLRNVTALAGEIEPLQGGSVTFAYVTNVDDPGVVTPEEVGLDELAHILLAHPRGIDMAALGPEPPAPAG
jgi:D-alanyl-D-alanine carboxypeptidase/D-alanyl-D-alanine-endopeptidase (penicillin-binding protein 4)